MGSPDALGENGPINRDIFWQDESFTYSTGYKDKIKGMSQVMGGTYSSRETVFPSGHSHADKCLPFWAPYIQG